MKKAERHGHERFYELLETIEDLHSRKNKNYASDKDPLSNFKMCEDFGVDAHMGCLVRMSDKWSRIQQLALGKPDLVGESIKDTLLDMAVYSLIEIILFEEYEQKAHKEAKK